MNETCGCCEGIEIVTPEKLANRPGLSALVYRAGTHATFLETMLARLSSHRLENTEQTGNGQSEEPRPLSALKIRDLDDPAIALLDAWATLADVLTFYQERLANEGFLRTATERRSVLELARLVGYRLRPGVAASVYLAFELEKDHNVEIPKGTRAQSIPGPEEMPQAFETSHDLEARVVWNALKPRETRPQVITTANLITLQNIYFKGTATALSSNGGLLFVFENEEMDENGNKIIVINKRFHKVDSVETEESAEAGESRTAITIQDSTAGDGGQDNSQGDVLFTRLRAISKKLSEPPSLQPQTPQRRPIGVGRSFKQQSDIAPQLLLTRNPALRETLYQAWRRTAFATKATELLTDIYAFRLKASPFGHNAPLQRVVDLEGVRIAEQEWPLAAASPKVEIKFYSDQEGQTVTGALQAGSIKALLTVGAGAKTSSDVLTLNSGTPTTPRQLGVAQVDISVEHNDVNNLTRITRIIFTVTFPESNTQQSIVIDHSANLNNKLTVNLNGQSRNIRVPTLTRVETGIKRSLIAFGSSLIIVNKVLLAVSTNQRKILFLDGEYDQIVKGSWVAIMRPPHSGQDIPVVTKVKSTKTITLSQYDLTAKVTQLELEQPWLFTNDRELSVARETVVYAQSERLELAEEPITDDIGESTTIELDGLFDGLKSGRWLVVSGERTGLIAGDESVNASASELVMLTSVTQGIDESLPGDTPHTTLHLANSLAYKYKRDTVKINANVAHATHGETRIEVLGSGDASKAFQEFKLSHLPLTYIAATTPSGIETTLDVRVNEVSWEESDNLSDLKPRDRKFISRRDDGNNTFVVFGNGKQGVRPPTGTENIKAVYRNGIGKSGNVKVQQISMLATQPLGVKGVLNPQAATGGADPEEIADARENTTVALMALGRAVSVQDYADFARAFAGIAKAAATRLSDGRRELVHLTIAGADDIPISENSDLFRNLRQALFRFGDPHQPLHVQSRELLLIVISAQVKLKPGYHWEAVEPVIRTILLEFLGFENRELGQDVLLSEIMSKVQSVEGVDYVDIDTLDALDEKVLEDSLEDLSLRLKEKEPELDTRIRVLPARVDAVNKMKPAQLAVLIPDVPDTLLLTERS